MSQNDIEVRIGAKTDELQNGMARVNRVIAESMNDIRAQFAGIGAAFNRLQGVLGGLALGALGQQAVSVMSSFEQLEIRLNSVMGSAAKGQEAFAWIQQFAKDTPFQVGEVTQAFMLLKNMGLEPMDGTLQAISDRAAQTGGGFETLQRISLALGQAWTKGKLQGEEAMQLLEAGVPVWDQLAKVLGKTTAEVQELSEKGRLGRDVIKALIEEIGQSSAGAAGAQMASLSGLWSNFADNVEGALNRLRKDGALDPLKQALAEINAEFSRLDANGTLAQWSANVAGSLKAVADGVVGAGHFVAEYGEQIKLLAEAYVLLKAAQAGSSLVGRLSDEMRERVAATAAARDKTAADLTAANASSVAAKQALLLAEAERTAAQAELRRAAAQAEAWQAAMREAQAETDLATRTRLTTQAQHELTAALAARNAAVVRAATATEALAIANTRAATTSAAATAAQIAFERATTLAGLAARGFSAVMGMLGGPLGIAMIALMALVTHWDDVAAAAGNAAAKSRKAANDIKQALNDVDVSRMRQGLKEATDEYNRIKLRRKANVGNRTIDHRALGQAEDDARGRMLMYQKGLDDVKATQAKNAYQPTLDKYAGESAEGRQRIADGQVQAPTRTPPALAPARERAGGAPPSRLPAWQQQLEDQRLAVERDGGRLSQQQEADFWAGKLQLAKAGSAERLQVERLKTKALIAQEREGAKTLAEIDAAQLEAGKRRQEGELQAEEQAYARQAALQGLSATQQEAALLAFEQRRLAIKQAYIDAQIAAMERDPDHNITEKLKLQEAQLQAERDYQLRLAEIKGTSTAEQAKPGIDNWQGAESDLGSLYENGLQRMLQGTLSFREAIRGVWAEIGNIMLENMVLRPTAELAAKYTREIAQEGAHQAAMFAIRQGWMTRDLAMKLGLLKVDAAATVTTETAKSGAVVAGETVRTGATATGTMARLGLKAMEAVKSILMSAWEAMASAFKAIVGIPYVGPVLAVGAGTAAFAAVSGLTSKIKSASGGYSIPRGVNPVTQLHEEEMVLPKPYANAIRDMAAGKSGGSNSQGSIDIPAPSLPPIQLTGVSAGEFFVASRRDLIKVLKAAQRDYVGG